MQHQRPNPGAHPADPDWIGEAARVFFGEVVLYLRTLVGVSLRPRRFAAAWLSGSGPAMQPLGFLATTVVIYGLWEKLVLWIMYRDADADYPLWLECLRLLGPYTYFATFGALVHALMRLGGPLRKVRSSVALAIYAGAGPASLTLLLSSVYFVSIRLYAKVGFGEPLPHPHPLLRLTTVLLLALMLLSFVVPLGMQLAVVHGLRRRRVVGGIAGALVVAGLISGLVRIQLGITPSLGSFMPEVVLWLRRTETGRLLPFFTLWF